MTRDLNPDRGDDGARAEAEMKEREAPACGEPVAWQNLEVLSSILTPEQYGMRLPMAEGRFRPLYAALPAPQGDDGLSADLSTRLHEIADSHHSDHDKIRFMLKAVDTLTPPKGQAEAERPEYWKRQLKHGIQYAVKQLHFNDKGSALRWVCDFHPQELEHAISGWSDHAPLFAENIWGELPAALPAQPAPAVGVKPLEWEDGGYGCACMTKSALGLYEIYLARDGYRPVYFNKVLVTSEPHPLGIPAAKAAAQADFEQRIRSALAIPAERPAGAGGVEDYELAETVHGEIVRIRPSKSLKEPSVPSPALPAAGEVVRCLVEEQSGLTLGKTYEVLARNKDTIQIEDDNGNRYFRMAWKFAALRNDGGE